MSKRIDKSAVKTTDDVIELLDVLFHLMPDETIDILIEREPGISRFFYVDDQSLRQQPSTSP